ncbi:MAG: pectinesterase, partial [Deltaproteobacteria bacterium]
AFDENQIFYYTAMGGNADDWSPQMFASIEHIAENVPNFRYWIQGGDLHGILPSPKLYTYAVDGMALSDWILDLVAGEDVPNVKCTECAEPELLE